MSNKTSFCLLIRSRCFTFSTQAFAWKLLGYGCVTLSAKFTIVIALVVLAFLLAAQEGPLEGMHWDVPIYLYQAKRFAETHYLVNYIRHAAEIVTQVHGNLPENEWFSEAFWRFVRLGHIAILGGVVGIFGSTPVAVIFATWLYTAFLMGGIGFCFLSVLILGRSVEFKSPWFAGAVISTLLFLVSDIYRYLAGNLVSEVLSIFLLGAAIFAMLQSVKTGRLSFAILSGLIAFLSYTTRVESVWTWLTFILAYLVTRGGGVNQTLPWKPLLTSGFTAFGMYLAYAEIFHPLVDPRHYLEFVSNLATKTNLGVPGYKLIFVAGGLLWIGALVCLPRLGQSKLVRLGWLWLLLSALPWLPQIMLGGACQTRMMTLLIPPLFLLSSAGWSWLLEQSESWMLKTAIAGSLCLALVSQPAVYAWLHGMPGMWRVQLAHPFLFAPNYERLDYLPAEMSALNQAIYSTDEPKVLISTPELSQEHLNLIRFFGSSYPVDADLALVGDPTNKKLCDHKSPALGESVLFCQGYSDPVAMTVHRSRYRILFLRPIAVAATLGTTLLLETPSFALDELKN